MAAISESDRQTLVTSVAGTELPGLFNPWLHRCAWDRPSNGPEARKERLHNHLAVSDPLAILIGEAPSYQGARYSGIPFTAEAHLLADRIPRIPRPEERLTNRHRPFSENSGSILWRILEELEVANRVILWNAVPGILCP